MGAKDRRNGGFPRTMAAIGGFVFLLFGFWAMATPKSFFDNIAVFEPFNKHFVQDIGAFQVGLGSVLRHRSSQEVDQDWVDAIRELVVS